VIENLAWDPDAVLATMSLSAAMPKPNSTSMPDVDMSCLDFYNSILKTLGPLAKITDTTSTPGFSTQVLDDVGRGLMTSHEIDKVVCQKRFRPKLGECLSGQKIALLERILQNSFYFNKTVHIEEDTFGEC
jgi:hypothetical protein